MEIQQIQTYLNSSNSQERLKGLTELRHYESAVAVPLLITLLTDPEFLVRSFVAMGLGNKRSPESFEALGRLLKDDRDHNVRAEAANALSKYGEKAIPHLVEAFRLDENWLVRRSILAPLMEMSHPEALYQICDYGLAGNDETVKETAIDGLGTLSGSSKQAEALKQLLGLVNSQSWRVRSRVALALRRFDSPQAKAALNYLKKDEDHRVVGAALEGVL